MREGGYLAISAVSGAGVVCIYGYRVLGWFADSPIKPYLDEIPVETYTYVASLGLLVALPTFFMGVWLFIVNHFVPEHIKDKWAKQDRAAREEEMRLNGEDPDAIVPEEDPYARRARIGSRIRVGVITVTALYFVLRIGNILLVYFASR